MNQENQQTTVSLPIIRTTGESLQDRMTDNAYSNILPARYLKKDDSGNVVETPEELFERVAKNVALGDVPHYDTTVQINGTEITEENIHEYSYDQIRAALPYDHREKLDRTAEVFHREMTQLSFMPNSPTLMNAGGEIQQLSACFVDSPDDDIDDIHQTAKEAAKIFQSGGGVGYDFSRLRPYGDQVGSTGGIASGPISFMRTFDQMCSTIAQGGKRRGAQMAIMRVDHPDVIEFIHAKNKDVSLVYALGLNDHRDYENNSFAEALSEARSLMEDGKVPRHLRNACEGHLANFNVSVAVTDAFMEALENDGTYIVKNPRTGEPHVATQETKEMYKWFDMGEYITIGEPVQLPAQTVWDRIVQGAHENGEPGVVFIDEFNQQHSFDVEKYPEYEMRATNPCGEQPLMEYEACNLGHINLSTVADESAVPYAEWDGSMSGFINWSVDLDELFQRVEIGVHFLDNVVTMSDFPIEEISKTVQNNRKIGLGIMGLAQLMIQLGIEYGSPEGNKFVSILMQKINNWSKFESHKLATERGVFNNWRDSKYAAPTEYSEWFEKHVGRNPERWDTGYTIRNHNTTTIAPTGTTSMIANTSGGCEPIYSVAHFKNVDRDIQGDDMLVEFDSYFLKALEHNDIDVETVKQEATEQMESNTYTGINGLSTVPDELARLFVTSSDLSGEEHAAVQCAAQDGIDSAISKTVNFPEDATIEDVSEVMQMVHENGGKGVTVYRDGSRSKQVLTTRSENTEFADSEGNNNTEEDQPSRFADDSDEETCPDCGSTNVEISEGCTKCQDCAHSACAV